MYWCLTRIYSCVKLSHWAHGTLFWLHHLLLHFGYSLRCVVNRVFRRFGRFFHRGMSRFFHPSLMLQKQLQYTALPFLNIASVWSLSVIITSFIVLSLYAFALTLKTRSYGYNIYLSSSIPSPPQCIFRSAMRKRFKPKKIFFFRIPLLQTYFTLLPLQQKCFSHTSIT